MKLLIIVTTILAIVYSTSLPPNENDVLYNEKKIEKVIRRFQNVEETQPTNLTEDAQLLVPEIITKYGYPSEVHTIETPDGYIIETHRIPYGRSGPTEGRPAVLLQHGLLASSADWILAGPGKGFAYILVDAGYDVWMPNARGSRYSKKHKTLHPSDDAKKFWNFSWHEIAIYDIAANIDHIIATTKQEKIFYIGHSQGTTVFYVLCAEKPEYNNKIRAMFSLAPIGYMKRITSPIMKYGAFIEPVASLVSKWFGLHEFLPHSELIGSVGASLCGDTSIVQILCTNALFTICGFNKHQMNATLMPLIMAHTPAGASTKQILHYAQEINSGYFRKYSFGYFMNKWVYGSKAPPNYRLKNIRAPVYFFYSKNDWMANPRDVRRLYRAIPKTKGRYLISDKKFNHIDFLYAMNAPKVLYDEVLKKMKKH